MNKEKEKQIRNIVKNTIAEFAESFKERHLSELDDPEGTINTKIHNVFMAELGEEIRFYSSLVRSFDSTFGNVLESLAIEVAKANYIVKERVEGPLSEDQTNEIARLLEAYKRRSEYPNIEDYQKMREEFDVVEENKRHESDYYLIDEEQDKHYLIELKIGGDLDNKKARSEKEALLEQYTILSNTLPADKDIEIKFGTAYNKFGEGNEWTQGRVLQYFSKDELLIGSEFWNFICKSEDGFEVVLDEYKNNKHLIQETLKEIKDQYLNKSPI